MENISYSVWVVAENGKAYKHESGLNKIAAECYVKYYTDRGLKAEVKEEKE